MKDYEFFLADLESRFKGIDKSKFYLSYSGGKDSHFLYWFIREYMNDREIEIASMNTYMEHPQIRERMYKYADTILLPKMKPFDIKEQFGSPCFSKTQDEWIMRWQNGSRSMIVQQMCMRLARDTEGHISKYALSQKASRLLLRGNLHKISPMCCKYLKKMPFREFEAETGKKPILGIRGGESITRQKVYTSCLTKTGVFTPLHDMGDAMLEKIYDAYDIEIPPIYQQVHRTGCMGCPYGSWRHNTEKELDLLNENQRKFVIEYFRESYDVLGVPYKNREIRLL